MLGMIPTERPSLQDMVRFGIDYTFLLNLAFLAAAAALLWLHFRGGGKGSPSREREDSDVRRGAGPRSPSTNPAGSTT